MNDDRFMAYLQMLLQLHCDCYQMDQKNPDVQELQRLTGEAALVLGRLHEQYNEGDDDASL